MAERDLRQRTSSERNRQRRRRTADPAYADDRRRSRSRSAAEPARRSSADRTRSSGSRQRREGSSAQARRRQSAPRQQGGVPFAVLIAAVLVSVLSSTLVTRCVMQGPIKEAQKTAKTAEREAAKLKNKVDTLEDQLATAQASAQNAGVDDPWVASGKFTTGDSSLDQEVKEFCDSHADSSKPASEAVIDVYTSIAWSEYVERDDAQHPAGPDWRLEYAHKYYEHDCSGNCYEFAAFLMYCMRYMGYPDAMCQGIELEFEAGSWGDHGIVFVTDTDGTERILDTARGLDGWMLDKDIYNYRIVDFESAGGTGSAEAS